MFKLRLERLVPATAVLGLVCCAAPPGAERPEPARVVGFRVHDGHDHGRTYRFEVLPDGAAPSSTTSRPMQVGIWYPASSPTDVAMSLGRYVRLGARADEPESPRAEELGSAAIRALEVSPDLDPDSLRVALARETDAYLDAPASTGRFPVILFAVGSGAPWYDNVALAESLARRGYVVLASRSAGAHHPYMSLDREGAEVGVDDLAYLAALAHTLPFTDRSRLGLVGRSWGAVPALLFAARNEVDAVVSLDGTISYNAARLRDEGVLPESSTDLVRVPLFVAVGEARPDGATPIDRATFFEDLTRAAAYFASYHRMQHASFASRFLDLYFAPPEHSRDPHRLGFAAAANDVGRFLDHHVANERAGLVRWPAPDDAVRTIESSAASEPHHAPDVFARATFDLGAEAAIRLHRSVTVAHPEEKLFGWRTLTSLCSLLVERGRYDDAVSIARFGQEQYPERAIFVTLEGRAWLASNQIERARDTLHRALALDEGQTDAARLLERVP